MVTTYLPPVNLGTLSWSFGIEQLEEPIMEGPEYVRTSRGGRWHMVRSGKRWIAAHDPDRLRETYTVWCGMWASDFQGLMLRDVVPDGEPVCGKCYGAKLGANPEVPGFIFEPRGINPPKLCPFSQTMGFREDPERWNRGWCLACGDYTKLRGYGHWSGSSWGLQRHPPGEGLVPPCPLHGWKQLTYDDTHAFCRCGNEGITT